MLRVDPELSLHRLHVDPSFRPIKKKKRDFLDEKNLAIRREVEEFIKSNAIKRALVPRMDSKYGHGQE
ncbi:hypothetical protein LIER_40538 [Lithospermum erythrorhizon]|uniref:Uncharacterized protein n=1 Tax=Lithospermum erythrorhizon TaxID=34254 RepID=A0AAV3QWB7_LITER